MLQFYTAEGAEGLHHLRKSPGLYGLVPKVLAVPTSFRTRAVLSNYAADNMWTGPAGFADMHECVHAKFTSDLPIFGSATNWSTWYGPDFQGHLRRFDAPTTPDGKTLYVLPGGGGFHSISEEINEYQYRIDGNLDWIHPNCLLEELYGIIIADYFRWSQRVTVNLIRSYHSCENGHVATTSVQYKRSWSGAAAIRIFMDTDAQTLFDRFCPISAEMVEHATNAQLSFDDAQRAYSEQRTLQRAELDKELVFHDLNTGAVYRRLGEIKTQIADLKARKASLKADRTRQRAVRDSIRASRDATNEEVTAILAKIDEAFIGHTSMASLSEGTRNEVNRLKRKAKLLDHRAEFQTLWLRIVRHGLDVSYAEWTKLKAEIQSLYDAKAALYAELEKLNGTAATVYAARDSLEAQSPIVPGFWDTASSDFTYYVQPSQAATAYLEKLEAFKANLIERKVPFTSEAVREKREELLREMVVALIEYKEIYDKWIEFNPVSRVDYGKAVMSAVEDIAYVDVNSIAYLKDLPEVFGEIQSLYKVIQNPADPTAWAGLVLNVSYGTRLTIADTEELVLGIQNALRKSNWGHQFAKTQGGIGHDFSFPLADSNYPARRTVNASVYYGEHDERFDRLIDEALRWDVAPTLGNMWDLVPYSFVIDWFVNVGQILEDMDTIWQAARLPVKAYFKSFLDRIDVPHRFVEKVCSSGQVIHFSHYERKTQEDLDLYIHPLEFSSLPPGVIPQAASLLVQNSKRI